MENIETLLAAVAQTQGFDDDEPAVKTGAERGLENSETPAVTRDGSGDARPSAAADVPPPSPAPVPTPAPPVARPVIAVPVEKKKRGRPKGQLAAKPPPPKRSKPEDEEEDVCFICFDGGSLVLCDRKGCPKAYHPACIKRDEAFFQSKSKWNCGWHICSVCTRKASHYLCYTCTYSVCRGCTKDADYICVRGNKGFCSICMKTIMLLENKDQANTESVQVDFDDQTSWEYLFKVYWVILKEKLSLTLGELTQATNPWKSVSTHELVPRTNITSAVSVDAPIPQASSEDFESKHLETAPPRSEIDLEKTKIDIEDHLLASDKDTQKSITAEGKVETSIEKASDFPCAKEAIDEPVIKKDEENVQVTEKRCLCKLTNNKEPGNLEICNTNTEWATKDLMEFVAHMKNGDASVISPFDVQTLLLDYIKKNNLRDPHRKSQIVCDQRLRNLFGKPRVGHIEMLKLLEFHFLIKEGSKKDPIIPAGLVGSHPIEMMVDGNKHGVQVESNSRKRKMRRKSDRIAPQPNNLNEYAAIDVHNMNLIYLRRCLMENLIGEPESFSNKVIESIVRIRISGNDQKPEVYRLVRVVGTVKVGESYKVGGRTTDFMLEVLNLDKKEVVSIDAVSDHEFTEDECKRLRQSIRCGLGKHFTVGDLQSKAVALQPVRIDDWLETEISRLNHLRDRASENGRKKELQAHVDKLELLKSPEERSRRISEILEVHVDSKMNPSYESEEDTKSDEVSKAEEHARPSYSGLHQNGTKHISPDKKDKEERTIKTRNRVRKKINAGGSTTSDKHTNRVDRTNSVTDNRNDQAVQSSRLETSTATASAGNSPLSSIMETEKLWHYRDPNSKIQGPFSMMQLRKWSTTGVFPPDMRIWTNHEQYDSLLLTDALNGNFHLASDSSNSGMLQVEVGTAEVAVPSEGTNVNSGDSKQTEPSLACNMGITSENNTEPVKEDASGSWPQCWDLLKDENNNYNNNNDNSDVAKACDLLPSSSLEKTQPALQDPCQESENGEKCLIKLTESQITSLNDLENQSKNEDCVPLPSEFLKSLNIHLGLDDIESGPICTSDPDNKHNASIPISDLLSSTQPRPADIPIHNFEILELLSPTPRPTSEDHGFQVAAETKFVNVPDPNPAQVWSNPSGLGLGEIQLPGIDNEWCGYSSSEPPKPPAADVGPPTASSNWLTINETIEFDSLGEEYVSELLDQVDAMESRQGGKARLPSPTAAINFARDLMDYCKDDDCFSSIEEFSLRSDALSSTTGGNGGRPMAAPSPLPPKPAISMFDFLTRSSVQSSTSSEGETTNNHVGGQVPACSGDAGSEFHPPGPHEVGPPGPAVDGVDPGWGAMQGNINLVTVQGNVNLVLGGPTGLGGWGTGQGSAWVGPSMNPNPSPRGGSLPWVDGSQRKYGGERFSSPREWGYPVGGGGSSSGGGSGGEGGGFVRGRLPWGGRQAMVGYPRSMHKVQRVCKFYESGHCKKGAFCDYLHP